MLPDLTGKLQDSLWCTYWDWNKPFLCVTIELLCYKHRRVSSQIVLNTTTWKQHFRPCFLQPTSVPWAKPGHFSALSSGSSQRHPSPPRQTVPLQVSPGKAQLSCGGVTHRTPGQCPCDEGREQLGKEKAGSVKEQSLGNLLYDMTMLRMILSQRAEK